MATARDCKVKLSAISVGFPVTESRPLWVEQCFVSSLQAVVRSESPSPRTEQWAARRPECGPHQALWRLLVKKGGSDRFACWAAVPGAGCAFSRLMEDVHPCCAGHTPEEECRPMSVQGPGHAYLLHL